MSAVAGLQATDLVDRPLLSRCVHAWSQLNRHHLLGVALAMLLMTAVDISAVADKFGRPGVVKLATFDLFATVVLFSITLLAWSAAVHGHAPGSPQRVRAVAYAVAISGLLAAAIVVPAYTAFGVHEIAWDLMARKKELPPIWLAIAGNTLHLGVFSFLFALAAEVLARRASTAAAVRAAQREQASVAREVLESRLAAMQAQVEPQFLFNSLVGIEALYQKDAVAAAENLDHLIQYLRVALPRLREPGSTIAAEIDLVRAYLAVVTSLHGGRPALTATVGDDCTSARFFPMLLLPLIQRAVREQDGALPESIRIGVQKIGTDVVIVTRIARGGGCAEDFELARVRERLAGLYGDRAALDCVELETDTTQFTLRVPADG
jgi:Histidine kinase